MKKSLNCEHLQYVPSFGVLKDLSSNDSRETGHGLIGLHMCCTFKGKLPVGFNHGRNLTNKRALDDGRSLVTNIYNRESWSVKAKATRKRAFIRFILTRFRTRVDRHNTPSKCNLSSIKSTGELTLGRHFKADHVIHLASTAPLKTVVEYLSIHSISRLLWHNIKC